MMEFIFRLYIFLDKRKSVIITIGFIGTFIWGFWVYLEIYGLSVDKAVSYAIGLFAVDAKTPDEIENAFSESNITMVKNTHEWVQVYTVSIVAKIVVLLTILLIYIREVLSLLYRNFVIRFADHTIVIGLGRNSRFFINSMLEKKEYQHKLIAFEINQENEYLDIYRDKKISIVADDVEKMLDSLNLEKCQNIFISTGSDEKNIYYSLKFLEKLKKSNKIQKLLVHIEDRTLRNFYSDEGILHNFGVDLKVFSFHKESARILFQKHALDGELDDIIQSSKEFAIYIVGDDDLSISILLEASKVAHFPNGNRLSINCIAKDTKILEKKVKYAFPEMDKIEHIKINYINLDTEGDEFYKADIWKDIKNLKHVFYCYDDVLLNIKIATKVKDRVFLRRESETQGVQFHIATMNHKKISAEIEQSSPTNLFVFAKAEEVCSYENLLNNDIDRIAKLINYDYYKINPKKSGYTKEQQDRIHNADDLWTETLINDKKSSTGQAIHIRTKLKFLGIEVISADEELSTEALLKKNRQIIENALALEDGFVEILDKLTISEHNRWMALLMTMDYQISEDGKKDKKQRLHPLLKPFSKFSDKERAEYVGYDVNAVLELAKYEAEIGNLFVLKREKVK